MHHPSTLQYRDTTPNMFQTTTTNRFNIMHALLASVQAKEPPHIHWRFIFCGMAPSCLCSTCSLPTLHGTSSPCSCDRRGRSCHSLLARSSSGCRSSHHPPLGQSHWNPPLQNHQNPPIHSHRFPPDHLHSQQVPSLEKYMVKHISFLSF
jgi:hypothetical protein